MPNMRYLAPLIGLLLGWHQSAVAQSDRPILPVSEIIQPDNTVPKELAQWSGAWLGKWDDRYYTALIVKSIKPNGFADIEYLWVQFVGQSYSVSEMKLAKIENGTLSFGKIKLSLDPANASHAFGELGGRNESGPVLRHSEFTKVQ